MEQIAIHSTLTRRITPLELKINRTDHRERVTMYVCGVTPYDDAHIGHGRCYVTFDVVYRLLRAQGYEVIYCRNVTNIDDKLLHRAEREYGDQQAYGRIAERYTARFHEDVGRLGCLRPTYEPTVTDHIPEIIAAIEKLIAAGHAYVAQGSVYFRIRSYPSYGKLSGQHIDEICAGARVEVNTDKENPLDFVVWKAEPTGSFWKSPWGFGRPGWHIECSALALKYLGETIDLHGGGMDLMFPHHENERAQSESVTGKPFVKIWMHNAFVRVAQEKMSKSLGNFVTLRAAFEKVEPMVLRYYYLIHHYRNPLDFSWDDIAAARKSYRRLTQLFAGVVTTYETGCIDSIPEAASLTPQAFSVVQRIEEAVCTDLNIQGAFGVIFEHLHLIKQENEYARYLAQFLQNILGLSLEPLAEAEVVITPEIQQLIDARNTARLQKDWKRADELRAQLEALGVAVKDTKLKE